MTSGLNSELLRSQILVISEILVLDESQTSFRSLSAPSPATFCPRSGLLCRWALNSMFVRRPSVRLSVRRHVFLPISSAVFTVPHFLGNFLGQLNRLSTSRSAFVLGYFWAKITQKLTKTQRTSRSAKAISGT